MPGPNILVVVVDGLRASSLGAYGNTTFATPALDQFAAESLLLDWCYAPTAELAGVYRALWQASDTARASENTGSIAGSQIELMLPRLFSDHGYETTLITDDAAVALLPGAADFRECIEIGRSAYLRADDISGTEMAQLFEAACDVIENRELQNANASRLVWVHSRGMYGPWDAPLDLQRPMLDESDPPPVESVAPPDCIIGDADDPDAAFRYGCAYAAQTIVLDRCWEGLLEAVATVVDEASWLVMLLGVRGFPLGEHGRVGGVDLRLYAEQLQVPWLIRFPAGLGRLTRAGQLVSHVDMLPTLLDAIGWPFDQSLTATNGMSVRSLASAARGEWRGALVATSSSSRAIRTDAWCLRQGESSEKLTATHHEQSESRELFVRPDDRWEANDVAKLCPEIVEELTDVLDDVQRRVTLGQLLPRSVQSKDGSRPDS